MTISTFEAAKTLGCLSGWRLHNLQMHKILYLAHMFYMGQNNGNTLIDEEFEAWDYGPVLPSLYHKLKFFGSEPVRDIFFREDIVEGTPESAILADAANQLTHKKPGSLVALTYRDGGAWNKYYIPGAKGRRIPNEDILQEYRGL